MTLLEQMGMASRNPNGSITCVVTTCGECGAEVLAMAGDQVQHCGEHTEE